MRRAISCACFLVAALALAAPASALEESELAKAGKAATALLIIGSDAAYGTAFCIDPAGLYVTNAHVLKNVAKDGKIKLVLDAGEAGQKEHEASVVKIGKYDDKTGADLAVIRISAGKPLPFLELGSVDSLVETTPVMAFGFPFGRVLATDESKHPNMTVSTGKITSLRKDQGKLSLIQLDALLNPGNSGGPVLDRNGKVVGVVWAGVPGAGVNLAIPVSALQNFVSEPIVIFDPSPVAAKDKSKPLSLEVKVISVAKPAGRYAVELALGAEGPGQRKVAAKPAADNSFQAKLVPVPETGQAELLSIQILWPKGQMVGSIADLSFLAGGRTVKLSEVQSIELRPKAAATLNSGEVLKGPVGDLGPLSVEVGGAKIKIELDDVTRILVQSGDSSGPLDIPCKVTVRLLDKTVAELSRTLQILAPERPPTGTLPPLPAGNIADLGDEPLARKLPGTADDIILAGGGRYLLVMMRQLRKVGIFDATTGKIERYVPLVADNCLMAAGADKLFLVATDQNIVTRHDLATGQKDLTGKLPVNGVIKAVCMGWNSRGPMLVNWAAGTGELDRGAFDFVDPQSLAKLDYGQFRPRSGFSYRDRIHLRASGDGTVFGMWCTSQSPSGLESLVLTGRSVKLTYQHDSVGHVVPSADGKMLLTASGLFSQEAKALGRSKGGGPPLVALPAAHASYYLTVMNPFSHSSGEKPLALNIMLSGNDTPLVTISNLSEMKADFEHQNWVASDFTLEKHFWFLPASDLLVTVPPTHDQLVLRRLNVIKSMEKAGVDYLFVSSTPATVARKGQAYSYGVEVKSKKGGVKFAVDGPPGMSISPAGMIAWAVPEAASEKEVPVIVTITDASGQQAFHTFNIQIQ